MYRRKRKWQARRGKRKKDEVIRRVGIDKEEEKNKRRKKEGKIKLMAEKESEQQELEYE